MESAQSQPFKMIWMSFAPYTCVRYKSHNSNQLVVMHATKKSTVPFCLWAKREARATRKKKPHWKGVNDPLKSFTCICFIWQWEIVCYSMNYHSYFVCRSKSSHHLLHYILSPYVFFFFSLLFFLSLHHNELKYDNRIEVVLCLPVSWILFTANIYLWWH